MLMTDIIVKKRDGFKLSADEIEYAVWTGRRPLS